MTRRDAALLAAALLSGCRRPAEPAAGGRDPVSGDPVQPIRAGGVTPKDEVQFAYALEIPDANGLTVTVRDTFRFRSGERFRLRWTADFPAHVYLFNRAPGSSSYVRLTPAPGEASLVGASIDEPARIPRNTAEWLRLDRTPGDEVLVLVVSRASVPSLERQPTAYGAGEFDRILTALERNRRARSLRFFDEGHWHKCVAAGPTDLAVISRLPLYHG